MTAFRTFVSVSAAALVTACANTGPMYAAPTPPVVSTPAAAPMAAMDPRMQAMRDMHLKMMNAKTPAERQALMAEHMKAMQGGMAMMKEMPGMAGMGGMPGAESMPPEMARHHQMMMDHKAMMQMMMDMMADRLPPATL
jgi:hypothetical protein